MPDTVAQETLHHLSSLKNDRASFDAHWRDIATLFCPDFDEFFESPSAGTQGERRNMHLYESTGMIALGRFASFMESAIVPRQLIWHTLRSENDDFAEDQEVKRALHKTNLKLFSVRNGPHSGFQSAMHSMFMSLGAFGNGGVFIDERMPEGCRYKPLFIGDTYIDVNHQNQVDTVFRCFAMSARAIAKQWPDAPEKVRKDAEKAPTKKYDVVHCIMPNDDYSPYRIDSGAMKYASLYILKDGEEILERSGYRTFPVMWCRYIQTAHEIYGRGPGTFALPAMAGLNEMKRTDLRSRHKMVDPPLLVFDDGVLGGQMQPDIRPGALNFGGVDSNGRQMIQPFQLGARLDLSQDGMQAEKNIINDAFFVSLFQILTDNPQMTATEVMMRMQEKGQLLGPLAGRMESEGLSVCIERELDVLDAQGELPEMPPQFLQAGGKYTIQYENPVNRAARAEGLNGIRQTIQELSPIAQIDPTVLDVLDYEMIGRVVADGYGAPPDVIRSAQEIARVKQQREQSQQAQMQMAALESVTKAMPAVAKTQLDSAKAQQIMRG